MSSTRSPATGPIGRAGGRASRRPGRSPAKLSAHAGGGITVIPPNIWQDNFLTGSTPFAVYPRLLSASDAPIRYGFQITPSQLPQHLYARGRRHLPAGAHQSRCAQHGDGCGPLRAGRGRADPGPRGQRISTSAASTAPSATPRSTPGPLGLERKFGNLTADASYVGTAGVKLPRYSFPNAYPGARPAFAPHTHFDSAGNVTGGFGVENVITANAHSTYHALQTSLSGTVGHGGPGIQASYTWSKSIDDTSQVIGGTGSTGAVASGFSQNPYDTHPEKGPVGVRCDARLRAEPGPGPASRERRLSASGQQESHRRLGAAEHLQHQLGLALHGLQRHPADRRWLQRRGPPRPDRQAASLHRAQGSPGLLWPRRQQCNGILLHPHSRAPAARGRTRDASERLGRNTFRGPAFYDFDFALIKDTPFGRRKSGAERVDLQFRSEFFNLFNIVNMGLPANIHQRLRLWRDLEDRRQLAADSVLAEADLLTSLRRIRQFSSACIRALKARLCYKGSASKDTAAKRPILSLCSRLKPRSFKSLIPSSSSTRSCRSAVRSPLQLCLSGPAAQMRRPQVACSSRSRRAGSHGAVASHIACAQPATHAIDMTLVKPEIGGLLVRSAWSGCTR